MKKYRILAINPGSTSTKIGVFDNEKKIFEKNIQHSISDLEKFPKIWEQYGFRKQKILSVLEENGFSLKDFSAVVGRGGLLKPIPSGTYIVDEQMIEDARIGYQGHHASNLGCVLAYSIAWKYGVPAFIVDPPSVDDFEPLARISGHKDLPRTSLLHALNIFATARKFAKSQNKDFRDLNLIVAHLGGGITVAALRKGKAINANHGLEEGPFTPERSGSLPVLKLIDLCFSGKYTKEQIKKMVVGKGGLVSYFGTNKAKEVEELAKAGSEKYKLVFEAMAYQVAEEIAARSADLKGETDAIILTGGIAYSEMFTNWIKERVSHIAEVYVFPGESELEALAAGALRVLRGEETAKHYSVKKPKIGIIYWDNLEPYIAAINYIEDYLRKKGFVFRKQNNNLEIIYANCNENEEVARTAINNFIDQNVDLIFAIGSPASMRVAKYLQNVDIPVIFTGLYNVNVFSDLNLSGKEFYASYYGLPIEEQFKNTVLKVDKVKKLGVLYHNGELQSNIEHDEVRNFCFNNKIDCVSFDIQEHNDLQKAAEFFEDEQVDWVFLGSDVVIATATAKILKPITGKFKTVCALPDTVKDGGLVSYHIPWKDLAEHAADIAVKLINNVKFDKDKTMTASRRLLINKEKAEYFGLLDKFSTIKNAKFI